MFQWIKKWQHQRILRQSAFSNKDWDNVFANLKLLHRLSEKEKTTLKQLATLFLHYKLLEGVGDIELNTTMQLNIALQACLLILNLGLNWYDGWRSVVIYPGAFTKNSIVID